MFSSQTDKVRDAAKLLTAAVAFGTSPGVKSGTSLYDAAKKLASKPPAGLKAMSNNMADLAREVFDGFKRDLPEDADILFEQMVGAILPSAEQITANQMNATRIADSMVRDLSDTSHTTPPMPELFRDIVTPVLTELFKDKAFAADLTPAYMATVLSQGAETASDVKDIKSMMQDFLAGKQITLDDMKALASRFGDHDIADEAGLKKFLTLKAEEYKALKSEVDSIEDGLKRLSNLKAAAQDAIARVDLDEVEELLSRVQEVELEEAAKTAELRANNALLRGRVEQAYRILSAAADSFGSVDPLEPARKRILSYFVILRNHGLSYGGAGLPLSRDLLAPVLTDQLRAQDAWLWAAGENARSVALRNQGSRTDGPPGAKLLAQAVEAYRAALEVRTRAGHPVDWAGTQNNLGNTLQNQGIRTDGPPGAKLLAQAVDAYRAALEVRTRAEHPVDWARTQNNLGTALQEQGKRTDGPPGAKLLAQAVDAYRAALEVRTRAEHPVDWAMTQNNLGIALQYQGIRTDGPPGAKLLAQAVDACRAALEVRTRAEHPVRWALTQNNLGAALQEQGKRTDGPPGAKLLAQAVDACRAALEVRTRAEHPVDWAMTQNNIASALLESATQPQAENPRGDLTAALVAVDGALEVYDPKHMSFNHANASRLRNRILVALDGQSD